MTRLQTSVFRLRRREDGSATIEFCIWFPLFILMFGSAFEASLITMRQVMMVGAVDRTVRELQLGNLGNPSPTELKRTICDLTRVIPDCMSSLSIEMERVSTANFAFRTGAVQCVDRDEETEPALNYATGGSNDLMLLTVCAAVRPLMPTSGLGLKLPKINGGSYYGVTAFSAYVVEPA